MKIFVILLVQFFAVSSWASSPFEWPLEQIEKIQRQAFDESFSGQIQESLQRINTKIASAPWVQSQNVDLEIFKKMSQRMLAEGKIRSWDAGTESSRTNGFYIPQTDAIFIRSSLANEEFDAALLHELIHGYQYRFRFSTDLITINRLVQEGLLKPKEVVDYIDYFYESQATWYTTSAKMMQDWTRFAEAKKPTGIGTFAKRFASAPKVFGQAFVMLALQRSVYDYEKWRIKPADPYEAGNHPLEISELIQQKEWPSEADVNLSERWIGRVHSRVASKVARAYFEKLPFLFAAKGRDQDVANQLHGAYKYRKTMTEQGEPESAGSQLQRILDQQNSQISPVESLLQSGKIPMVTGSRNSQAYQILTRKLNVGPQGGVGTSPTIRIQPQVRIRP